MKTFDPTKCAGDGSGGLPDGGDVDDLLLKDSSTNGDATWHTGLPATRITSEVLPVARGGTNSGDAVNANRIVVTDSGGTKIVEATAITASKALVSDSSGIPVASSVGSTDIAQKSLKLDQFAATTSSELADTISDETGTGELVFNTDPTFIGPVLGTPASGTATNLTGLPLGSGVTGTLPIANGGTNSSSGSAAALNNIPVAEATGVLPVANGGTNSSSGSAAALNNIPVAEATGVLPVANGGTNSSDAINANRIVVTNSAGTKIVEASALTASKALVSDSSGIPTASSVGSTDIAQKSLKLDQFAATSPSELRGVISGETGTGDLVFADTPTLIAPLLGTPTSGVATNLTGLPLGSGVTGTLPLTNGGTGTSAGSANAAFAALSPTTTKGDLIVYSNTGTDARLGVGLNGRALIADSAETPGVRWGDVGNSGSGHNYVTNPNATADATTGVDATTGDGSGTFTVDRTTTAAELPEEYLGTAFKCSGDGDIDDGDYIAWTMAATGIADADGGRFGTAEMKVKDISGTISGDYRMQVYNTTTTAYVGNSVNIEGTGYYYVDVPLIAENRYQVHLIARIASPSYIGVSGVTLSSVSASTGAIVTAWQDAGLVASDFVSFDDPTSINAQYRRVGENLEFFGYATAGATPEVEIAKINLPLGLTVKQVITGDTVVVGNLQVDKATNAQWQTVLATDGDTFLNIGQWDNAESRNTLAPCNASVIDMASQRFSWTVSVPVAEFANSTSLNVSDVQFANARFTATQLGSLAITPADTEVVVSTWTATTLEGGGSFDGTLYTIPADGWYEVKCQIKWANAAFGPAIAQMKIFKNSSAINTSYEYYDGANNPTQMSSYAGRFSKDDTVKIVLEQDAGTIPVGTTADESLFYVVRVSDTSARKVSILEASSTEAGLLNYYQETTVTLDEEFTGDAAIRSLKIVRIGGAVFITGNGVPSHATSLSNASSSVGLIPPWACPLTSNTANAIWATSVLVNVRVATDGTISTHYGAGRTDTYFPININYAII